MEFVLLWQKSEIAPRFVVSSTPSIFRFSQMEETECIELLSHFTEHNLKICKFRKIYHHTFDASLTAMQKSRANTSTNLYKEFYSESSEEVYFTSR